MYHCLGYPVPPTPNTHKPKISLHSKGALTGNWEMMIAYKTGVETYKIMLVFLDYFVLG